MRWSRIRRVRYPRLLALKLFAADHFLLLFKMRVSMYTEIEPPEQRPCPPLPLDGPVLLEVVPAPVSQISTPPVLSDYVSVVALPVESLPPSQNLLNYSFWPSLPHHMRFGPATKWLVLAVALLLAILEPVFLSWMRSDASLSGLCLAWQGSGNLLPGSCPRLDSCILLPESCPYSCPAAARRGDVDSMARGLLGTSLAHDVKLVMKMCLPGARRGLATRLISGILISGLLLGVTGHVKFNPSMEGFAHIKYKFMS
ncbi:hypothetical protein B0H19DRAFT_1371316, partial [Mycena capillaripes]